MSGTSGEADASMREQLATLMAQMQEQSARLQTHENENEVYRRANEEVRMENRRLRERVDSQSTIEQASGSSSRAPTQRVLSFDTPPVAPAVRTGSRVTVGYEPVVPPSHHTPSFSRGTPGLEAVAVDPYATPAVTRVTLQGVPHPPPSTNENTSRWCEFHRDHGHTTEQCIALRYEVLDLLKRRHLKQFLTDKGKATLDSSEKRGVTPPAPPPHAHTINVIIGGSEINSLTYSAAKRHAREMASINIDRQAIASSSLVPSPSYVLNFADTEVNPHIHHDALVISVTSSTA